MSSYPHIAVWVGNVPHALPKRALVEVLASLAGSNFVPPANVVMTHRSTFRDSEYSHAMMYFWNQSAAELAVSLLNNYYSEHLGTRLLARLAQPGTAETKAKVKVKLGLLLKGIVQGHVGQNGFGKKVKLRLRNMKNIPPQHLRTCWCGDLCYTIGPIGRRLAFRAVFWPVCYRADIEIRFPAGRRLAGVPFSVVSW